MQGGLLIDFDNSGGHAVLLMKAGQLPTLLNADFTFRSEELVKGDQARSQSLLVAAGRPMLCRYCFCGASFGAVL